MKIYDENNNLLDGNTIDREAGHLVSDTITIEHPAVEAVEEQGHYVTIAEYPNGGKDVEWVVDVAGVKGCEAWTETEKIMRYVAYTEEELAAIEAAKNAPSQLDRIEAQAMYTALMTDTLLEDE